MDISRYCRLGSDFMMTVSSLDLKGTCISRVVLCSTYFFFLFSLAPPFVLFHTCRSCLSERLPTALTQRGWFLVLAGQVIDLEPVGGWSWTRMRPNVTYGVLCTPRAGRACYYILCSVREFDLILQVLPNKCSLERNTVLLSYCSEAAAESSSPIRLLAPIPVPGVDEDL